MSTESTLCFTINRISWMFTPRKLCDSWQRRVGRHYSDPAAAWATDRQTLLFISPGVSEEMVAERWGCVSDWRSSGIRGGWGSGDGYRRFENGPCLHFEGILEQFTFQLRLKAEVTTRINNILRPGQETPISTAKEARWTTDHCRGFGGEILYSHQ